MSDFYEDLGVPRDATPEEIKRAHRKAARRTHPDIAGDESRDEFERVQTAYVVLSDPEKRARYDRGEETDADAENPFRDMVEIIVSTFKEAMFDADVDHDDLIEATRERLAVKCKDARLAIAQAQTNIEKLENIIRRVSSVDGPNFIARALDDTLCDCRRDLEMLEKRLAAHITAHERCDDFMYLTDPEEPEDPRPWTGNVKPAFLPQFTMEQLGDIMKRAKKDGD